MKSDMIKTEIDVKGSEVCILRVGDIDYISFTDLTRYIDKDEPRLLIIVWKINKTKRISAKSNGIIKK